MAAALTVIGLGDAAGTCPTPATCASLRQAINTANSVPFPGLDTISFTVNGTINVGSVYPTITESLTIVGPALPLTVDSTGSRLFIIDSPGNNQTVTISALNITGVASTLVDGGAITLNTGDTLNLSNSAIFNNVISTIIIDSGSGAGLFNNGGTANIVNSTFSGNSADNDGGGIRNSAGTTNLNNVTITNNTAADDGGGISQGGGTVTLNNTILANNINGDGSTPNCNGTITSNNYNLLEDSTGCTIAGAQTGDVTGVDPDLGPLQNNGGNTLTRALLTGSAAIGAGNPATPAGAPTCETTDQRGVTRPQGTVCDIGAFEFSVTSFDVDLEVTKQLTTPVSGLVDVGDTVTYTMTVTNNGTDDALNVRLTDQMTGPVDFTITGVIITSTPPALVNPSCTPNSLTQTFPFNIVCDLGTIEPGQTATVEVTGTINDAGYYSDAAVAIPLSSVDQDLSNNTATVALSTVSGGGTGTITVPGVDPFVYAATQVGSTTTQVFTLTESSGLDLYIYSVTLSNETDFTIVDDQCSGQIINDSVLGDEECDVTVAFSPQSATAGLASTLIFATSASSPAGGLITNGLEGDGTGNPVAVVDPTTLDFGSIDVGSDSGPLVTHLSNTGTTDLTVTADPAITGSSDFTIVNAANACVNGTVLVPGEDCIVQVVYSPSASGAAPATTLDFATDGGNPSVTLLGSGTVNPVAEVDPTTLDFGSIDVGSDSGPLVTHLSNTGTTDLTVTADPAITGSPDFTIVNAANACVNGTVLVPGQDCVVQVVYSPSASGAAPATTLDFSTDGGTPSVTLLGTGTVNPNAVVDPTTLDFGSIDVGSDSGPLVTHLSNTGTTDLTVTADPAITGSSDFTIVNAANACVNGTVLVPGQDCVVQVVYSPSASGAAPATTLDFASDGGTPSVTLTGNGAVGPISSAAPNPLAFGSVPVGTTSEDKVVQLTNTGTTTLTFSADPVITGGGEYSILSQTCTVAAVGSLEPGEDCLVQVVFSPTSTAVQPATTLDFTDDGGSASVTLTGVGFDNQADLSVVKTVDVAQQDIGEDVVFTLLIENNGPAATTDTEVRDTISTPSGVFTVTGYTFQQGSGVCTPAVSFGTPAIILCDLDSIPSGGVVEIDIEGTVDGLGEIHNHVSVFDTDDSGTPATIDPNHNNNDDAASVNGTSQADLSIDKDVIGPSSVNIGDTVTLEVTITNNGPNDATGVSFRDIQLGGLSFDDVSLIPGGCSINGNVLDCDSIGTIVDGGSVTFTFTMIADVPGFWSDIATVSSDVEDHQIANNTTGSQIAVEVSPDSADLELTKTASVNSIQAGGTVTYTLSITNNGPDDADSVVVTDYTTASGGAIGAITPPVGCNAVINGVFTCNIPTIVSGDTETLTYSVGTVAPGTINDIASVSALTNDPAPDNNTAAEVVEVTGFSADLSLVKEVAPNPVTTGGTVTYTLTVTNNGPDDATEVTLLDQISGSPQGVTATATDGVTCNVTATSSSTTAVSCDLGDMSADANDPTNVIVVTITITANGNLVTFSNLASVLGDTDDPNLQNNFFTGDVVAAVDGLINFVASSGCSCDVSGRSYPIGRTMTVWGVLLAVAIAGTFRIYTGRRRG